MARRLGDAALLGRAALGHAGQWSILGRVDEERVAVLEEALAGLGDEDSPLRARLLARLALELYYSGDPARRLALSEEAVDLARRLGDPRTLAACLDARHYALWRPENVDERLAVAAELRKVAEQTGDPELELEGAGWTVVDLLEVGDMVGADVQIAAASKLADALHRPLWRWWTSLLRCTRAQIMGDFATAEQLADETLEIGRHGQAENAVNAYAQAIFNIRREQGRLAEVEPAVRRFIDLYPALVAWRAGLALLLVELDRADEARVEFELIAAEELPRDANWLIGVTLLAEVCGALGDGARAEGLYTLLEPYAGRNVVVGRAATCNGSASRLLGILATAMRSWELAEGHFIDALSMHERMGARPWVARTQLAYAEMLLTRRRRGDRARARELLADAVGTAEALGMDVVAARARALAPDGRHGRRAALTPGRIVRRRAYCPGAMAKHRPSSSAPRARPSPRSGTGSARAAARGTRSPRRLARRRARRVPVAAGAAPCSPSGSPTCDLSATRGCRPGSASSTGSSAAASCRARSCSSAARRGSASRR